MKRALQALLALALLPLLVSASEPTTVPSPRSTVQVQACHYEAEISGTHTYPNGSSIVVPIGRIVVTACTSPEDLARRVEELTNNVRRQATAQAINARQLP
jgi:Ni,Fe-hydrogenase III small subunit